MPAKRQIDHNAGSRKKQFSCAATTPFPQRLPGLSVRHCSDVIMSVMTSQITSLLIVYSTVYSDADQRKHQSSASLAFVRGIHRRPVNSPHKWPVTRKMYPFDDVTKDNQASNINSPWWPLGGLTVSVHRDDRDVSIFLNELIFQNEVTTSWYRVATFRHIAVWFSYKTWYVRNGK